MKMKKLALIISFVLLGTVLNAQTKTIAHRGFWDTEGSAQNSLKSLRLANDIHCFGSEFDVWITKDGEVMVNHDPTFQNVTLETATYDEVKNLKLSNGEQMPTLKEYLNRYPNFGIAATWHDELGAKKDQKFKDNLLFLKDSIRDYYSVSQDMMYQNVMVSFVLFDGNGRMYDKAKWLVEHEIWYGFTHLYTDHKRVQKYVDFSEEAKWVFENAVHHKNKYTIDDRQLSPEEFEEEELYQISFKYNTVCEPLNFHIGYLGDVISSCKYLPKITYNLKEQDITPKRVFCKGYDCYCSALGYKELHGQKDNPNRTGKRIIPITPAN